MTAKKKIDLEGYRKSPRLLQEDMERDLRPGRGLHPVLMAVARDDRLRLEIRERRFNVYYAGGSLLLVDGRKSPWVMRFDEKYFKGSRRQRPPLPTQYSGLDDSRAWVEAFPILIAAMDEWWNRHPAGERHHCQAMAAANSARTSLPSTDYLVLDLEYQWAQSRFDMVAARRRPTDDDPSGWIEPDLAFVEVKSDYRACTGKSGLSKHTRDYQAIVTTRGNQRISDIKSEYEEVIAQKRRLGLLDHALPFRNFSRAVPKLLIVFVNLDPKCPSLGAPLADVKAVSDALGADGRIRVMRLSSSDYRMNGDAAVPLERLNELR